MQPDSGAAEPIRRAVASGEFRKALALWEDYARQLRQELRSGTLSSEKFAEMRDLVEWCGAATLCARAQAQAQLNRAGAAQQYFGSRSQPAPRISTSG